MAVKKIGDSEWIIAIKDTPYNVVHNAAWMFVVYRTREEAISAAKVISELRKVKYV